ncbi:hypothetical protein YC2023_019146 [Brassica napus]
MVDEPETNRYFIATLVNMALTKHNEERVQPFIYGPKRNNVVDRLDYPIDRSRISRVPRNVLGKSRTFFINGSIDALFHCQMVHVDVHLDNSIDLSTPRVPSA